MSPWQTRTAGLLGVALLWAQTAQTQEASRSIPPSNQERSGETRLRLDLSHLVSDDTAGDRHLALTDLRLTAEVDRVLNAPVQLRFDQRFRYSWNPLAEDRLTVSELYAKLGEDKHAWRLTLGRQLVQEVPGAEIDGVRGEWQISRALNAFIVGGLQPDPWDGAPNLDFAAAGSGYSLRQSVHQHQGGAMVSLYQGSLDRIYLSQRSYARPTSNLQLAGFVTVDLLARQPLLSYGQSTSSEGIDLTTLHGMVRWEIQQWWQTTLSLNHHHTVVPNKWWYSWLNEQRRRRGFVIDGIELLGTRLTSLTWSNDFAIRKWAIPYFRLRYNHRHNESTFAMEGRVGMKWRWQQLYSNINYTYRRRSEADNHLAEFRAGGGSDLWGAEGGAVLLFHRQFETNYYRPGGHLYTMLWVAPGQLAGLSSRVQVYGQYMGFYETELLYHTFFAGIAYRL